MVENKIKLCIGDMCRILTDSAGSILGRGLLVSEELSNGKLVNAVKTIVGNENIVKILKNETEIVYRLVESAIHLNSDLKTQELTVCNIHIFDENLSIISEKLNKYSDIFRAASTNKTWKGYIKAHSDQISVYSDPEWYRHEIQALLNMLNSTLNLIILESSFANDKLKAIEMIDNKKRRKMEMKKFLNRCKKTYLK